MSRNSLYIRAICMLVSVSLLLSTTACGNRQVSGIRRRSSSENANVQAGAGTVVTDHLGRKVTIDGKVETIVSGYYITTSLLIALGLEDKLAGVEAKAETRPIYSLAAPRILKLPNIGTAKDFDIEACIALKPDIVILPVKLKDSVATLEKLGIKVIAVNPENMDLLKETVTMIGKATGTEKRAEQLIAYYDQKLDMVAKLASSGEARKTVYLAGNSSMLSTATSKMYQNSLIEAAGGINAAAEIEDTYWATVSYEQLISYDPDMIVVVPFAAYTKEEILNDKRLSSLKAVKNSAVYKMPDNLEAWDSPVPSGILGIMWLASILNEKAYPFDEFKNDVAEFYKEFYDIEINAEEIEK